MELNRIICGDALTELKKLPNDCIDLIITSPPYYGLRNYQVEGQIGLELTFEEYLKKMLEITRELFRVLKKTGQFWLNMGDCYGGLSGGGYSSKSTLQGYSSEDTKGRQMAKSFVGFDKKNYGGLGEKRQDTTRQGKGRRDAAASKCLLMQPERLAIKMIDEQGWILRNKIKWAKQILLYKQKKTVGSVMPTSVKDRFNESGEELYFFVKSKKYYSDLDAVRLTSQTEPWGKQTRIKKGTTGGQWLNTDYFNYRVRDAERKAGQPQFRVSEEEIKKYKRDRGLPANYLAPTGTDHNLLNNPLGKNIPTIWQIGSEPHNFQKELGVDTDHFAVFPEALCEIPIKFGCPKEICKKCGKVRETLVNRPIPPNEVYTNARKTDELVKASPLGRSGKGSGQKMQNWLNRHPKQIIGFTDCGCSAGFEPGIVLDPFMGSGTTAVVARKLGRNYLGIELNGAYVKIAEGRTRQGMLL